MAKFKLVFRKSIKKDLRYLPNRDIRKILDCINSLADNPFPIGVKKLKGQDRYRIRQGVYRILYEVQNKQLIITLVKVGHRKSVYQN